MFKGIIESIKKLMIATETGIYINKEKTIKDYTHSGYTGVNILLWKTDSELHVNVKNLKDNVVQTIGINSVMQRVDKDMVLYRGTNANLYFDSLSCIQEGMMIPFKGVTSTSTKLDVANYFTQNNPRALDNIKPVVFKINVPAGRSAHIENDIDGESEVILPPAIYEVNKVETQENNIMMIEITQKELLDVQDLILDGLDYVKQNVHKVDNATPAKIDKMKKQVSKFFNYREKFLEKTEKSNSLD